MQIERLDKATEAQLRELAAVLVDCVRSGASVSFMQPIDVERVLPFWRDVAESAGRGERVLLVARDAEGIAGTVQVLLDMPENQPHRADVLKMLVHNRARRRGVGALLMRAAEAAAREAGKTLMTLDTSNEEAERLYEREGWQRVGTIPGYALWPQGGLCPTTFFYLELK